jgi:RluA family pseudouridine synthase
MTHPEPVRLPVLYEDEDIRAIGKPSGLSVLMDNTGAPSLADRYLDEFKEPPLFVHRLDKGTSGALLLARREEARKFLSRSFAKGVVKKTYLALVSGIPKVRSGRIEFPLEKARKGKFRVARNGSGLPAITEFRVVKEAEEQSLLEIYPLTGRTHQIRAHLQALGHPLVQDPLYGLKRAKPSLHPTLTLHAWRIEFPHPIREERISIEAEAPLWASRLLG